MVIEELWHLQPKGSSFHYGIDLQSLILPEVRSMTRPSSRWLTSSNIIFTQAHALLSPVLCSPHHNPFLVVCLICVVLPLSNYCIWPRMMWRLCLVHRNWSRLCGIVRDQVPSIREDMTLQLKSKCRMLFWEQEHLNPGNIFFNTISDSYSLLKVRQSLSWRWELPFEMWRDDVYDSQNNYSFQEHFKLTHR